MQSLIISPRTTSQIIAYVHLEQICCLIDHIQQSPPTVLRKAMTIAINKSMTSFQDQGAILLIFTSLMGGFSSISSASGWPWFALSRDGMNPFDQVRSNHSTWPVTLCIYNLPPWVYMKWSYIQMSLLIQGPRQPGNASMSF